MYTSGFGAAILDIRLPVTFVELPNRTVEMPDPENTGVVVVIVALYMRLGSRDKVWGTFVSPLATFVCKSSV